MGGVLDLPTAPRHTKGRKWEPDHAVNRETDLQGRTPVILPFNSFDIRPDRVEETEVRTTDVPPLEINTPRMSQTGYSSINYSSQGHVPDTGTLEVETTKMNSTFSSGDEAASSRTKFNYIKRYRNEEEKLLDMLHEREATLKTAIKQGQLLRAKCNRYKEEIESLKSATGEGVSDNQWKRKYFDMDKKYRDVKEELDVFVARNKNGRDFLEQQKETIDVLNVELQQEKLHKQQIMSQSLSSLQGIGTGVTDKKGKMAITRLKIDNKILEERVNDLLLRNQRGRNYLAKMEAENRENQEMVARLKSQLLQERADKDRLLAKLSSLPGKSPESPESMQLYAQVQRKHDIPSDENHNFQPEGYHREGSTKASSGGFEADYQERRFDMEDEENGEEVNQPYRVGTASYEEIDFNVGMAKAGKDSDSEEEVVIEAVIESDTEDNATDNAKHEAATLRISDTSDKDVVDSGKSPSYEPYEPKSVFAGDVITRF